MGRRPFIHINYAAEDGGSTSAPTAADGTISCCSDWRRVHTLRERYDAIAVGGKTWNIDRPRLTVRSERLGREPRRQPSRVIFAGSQPCQVPQPGAPAFVISSRRDVDPRAVALPMNGYDLRRPLEGLYDHGIRSLLVEGGPTLLRSFINQGVVDVMSLFVRAGTPEAADRGVRDSLDARSLDALRLSFRVRAFGEGFLMEAGSVEAAVDS